MNMSVLTCLNTCSNICANDVSADELYSFEQWLNFSEPEPELVRVGLSAMGANPLQRELRTAALWMLQLKQPDEKLTAMRALYRMGQEDQLLLKSHTDWRGNVVLQHDCPGRPERPELIPATQTLRRSMNSTEGRAIMVHALAHIEFNAINLALDAMVRFADLSDDYYWDWWRVAAEEAYHFSLIQRHLRRLGAEYGDYPAHDGLWDMAERTQHSFADRMAMVPRTLEARGLDACPIMQEKFRQVGDEQAARILDIILRDEITHVALGHRWFIYACTQNQAEPIYTYRRLAEQYHAPRVRPPFNWVARRAAGFFEEELSAWQTES